MKPIPSCTISKPLSVRKCQGNALQKLGTDIFKSVASFDKGRLVFTSIFSIRETKSDRLSSSLVVSEMKVSSSSCASVDDAEFAHFDVIEYLFVRRRIFVHSIRLDRGNPRNFSSSPVQIFAFFADIDRHVGLVEFRCDFLQDTDHQLGYAGSDGRVK